eukprot:scaffold35371_cov64-Phaeocystis_antarctica.AAC.2
MLAMPPSFHRTSYPHAWSVPAPLAPRRHRPACLPARCAAIPRLLEPATPRTCDPHGLPSQPSHPWRTLSVLPRPPMLRRKRLPKLSTTKVGAGPSPQHDCPVRTAPHAQLPLPAPAPVPAPEPMRAPAPVLLLAPAPQHPRSTHPYTSSLRCRSMQGPRCAMLLHLAMMFSKVSGWGLPSDDTAHDLPLSSHESAITGEVDGAHDRRRLASSCDTTWCVPKPRPCSPPSPKCAVAFLSAAEHT